MNQSVPHPDELEARLAELHEASFGWACSCCAWNESDAEDVLQTTYVKVISGRARYEGRSAFRTWLFGVIRMTALEHRRRDASRARGAERYGSEVEGTEAVETPDDALSAVERRALLQQAIAELPPRQQEVLHLVFYQDLTVQEAAEVMEVSVGSARVHYDRAKKRLRALLAESRSGGDL